jgi:hypothetical protein
VAEEYTTRGSPTCSRHLAIATLIVITNNTHLDGDVLVKAVTFVMGSLDNEADDLNTLI